MKERATVLCRRGDRILLVARLHARWVLPGGKPRRGESLDDAARRELHEETGLVCRDVHYPVQRSGQAQAASRLPGGSRRSCDRASVAGNRTLRVVRPGGDRVDRFQPADTHPRRTRVERDERRTARRPACRSHASRRGRVSLPGRTFPPSRIRTRHPPTRDARKENFSDRHPV
ncbi:NUDIX domain-containing protein [Burkholderia cenocepacia]|uniref:NUDIX domain-containing protein n=1 Tax=Burkholderia cenocepacia TaxID=95486 RepID=UPI001FC8D37D|nr:NUDIX domain-containing protein [Burkholderia cenocepacia]